MHLSCTVFEIQGVIYRKLQSFLTHVYLAPLLGMIPLEFHQDLLR